MRRVVVILAVVCATILLFAGCGSPDPVSHSQGISHSSFPLTITDANGRGIVIEEAPDRIIAIDSAAVEILFSIGEGGRIVGVHDFVSFPPEANSIEKIGGAFSLNLEKIVALEPDLVVVFFDANLPDLHRLGIKTLYLSSPNTLAGISGRIRTWGRIIGQSEKGDQLAFDFDRNLEEIRASLAKIESGPRIYHDEAPGWWTAGSNSLANDIYEFLNAQNVFSDVDGYAQVSIEEIIARDPEVIVSVHPGALDLLASEPGLQGVSAITNDRAVNLNGDLLSIPGPRVLDGIKALARSIYE